MRAAPHPPVILARAGRGGQRVGVPGCPANKGQVRRHVRGRGGDRQQDLGTGAALQRHWTGLLKYFSEKSNKGWFLQRTGGLYVLGAPWLMHACTSTLSHPRWLAPVRSGIRPAWRLSKGDRAAVGLVGTDMTSMPVRRPLMRCVVHPLRLDASPPRARCFVSQPTPAVDSGNCAEC